VTRLPSKGPNSPFSAGNRTILARTCSKCGELADGDSFPLINQGAGGRRKVCHRCQNRQKKIDRIQRGIGVPEPRPPLDLQTSSWTQWESGDDDILRKGHAEGRSYEEIAIELGRSLSSVYQRRVRLGLSRVRATHRVEKPWRIG
jgi:hypothetical protein